MRVAVRADSGSAMGVGHVMRCLTLVTALKQKVANLECVFFTRNHQSNIDNLIERQGFQVWSMPVESSVLDCVDLNLHKRWLGVRAQRDAADTVAGIRQHFESELDLLIVDHYGCDQEWHGTLRQVARRILVVDDLADRPYDADILVDQTYGRRIEDYRPLVSSDCRVLVGTKYALLRPEFQREGCEIQKHREIKNDPIRILVSLGGSDSNNVSKKVVDSLLALERNHQISLILGAANSNRESLRSQFDSCEQINVFESVTNMAEMMKNHDLAIGAAGATSWERCAMGLPSILVVLADNQQLIADHLEKAEACVVLSTSFDELDLEDVFRRIFDDGRVYKNMVRNCLSICDGDGSRRVVKKIERLLC